MVTMLRNTTGCQIDIDQSMAMMRGYSECTVTAASEQQVDQCVKQLGAAKFPTTAGAANLPTTASPPLSTRPRIRPGMGKTQTTNQKRKQRASVKLWAGGSGLGRTHPPRV